MSFVDKFKKILFDDVDDSEELPERTPKNKKESSKSDSHGFIDYHNEEEEENPIREIKVPQEEKALPKVEEQVEKFNFPIDTEYDAPKEVPTRQRNYEEMDINFLASEPEDEVRIVKEVNSFATSPKKEIPRKERDTRDYRRILEKEETKEKPQEKKPFTNTPVISPVWGILDKNYKPEEIVDRTDALTKVNTGAVPRSYGPVSYNDQPLVQKEVKKPEKSQRTERVDRIERPTRTETKVAQTEELIELNTAITDLINEPIAEENYVKPPIKKEKKAVKREIPREQELPSHSISDIDDDIIKTDNYDEIEEVSENFNRTSIDINENDNNNIEDAFESTSEFDSIRENDEVEDIDDEVVDMESIISRPTESDSEEDAGLDNTIETDLFNLIDSMYKDEDE